MPKPLVKFIIITYSNIMIKIYSRSNKGQLLHILYKRNDFDNRQDLVDPKEFLQVASLVLNKNQTFNAHKHLFKSTKNNKIIAQESWVVISGKIKVDYFDLNDLFIESYTLEEGDCTITLYGGHNYTSLTENTLVYEFKTGPYDGQSKDKILLK